jgi:hypothetical protein
MWKTRNLFPLVTSENVAPCTLCLVPMCTKHGCSHSHKDSNDDQNAEEAKNPWLFLGPWENWGQKMPEPVSGNNLEIEIWMSSESWVGNGLRVEYPRGLRIGEGEHFCVSYA